MEQEKPKPKENRKKWYIITGCLAACLSAAAVLTVLVFRHHSSPFPESVRKQVSFALYSPAKTTSNDWKIMQSSIAASSQAVTYEVAGEKGIKFAVSIQPIPADFDFTAFKKKFFTTDEFTTAVGSALVGEVGNSIVASIRTNQNSWILINTSYTTSQAELTDFVRHLELSN